MDLAALIVAFGVLVVSGVAAAAAVVQARHAGDARRDAELALVEARKARDDVQDLARVSTAAFVRQAEAQERANEIEEAKMRPHVWTHRYVSGDAYAIENTSGKDVVISGVDIDPDDASQWLGTPSLPEALYEPGQSWRYLLGESGKHYIRRLVVHWRFASDSDDVDHTTIVSI